MFQNTANVIQCHLADTGVFIPSKEWLAVFPDRLVDMHPGAVVIKNGFRHKGDGFAIAFGNIFDDVFVKHQLIRHFQQRVKTHINFSLSSSGDFVMLFLNDDPGLLHFEHHFGSKIHKTVNGWYGEISLFVTWFVSEVRSCGTAVPNPFFRIDKIIGRLGCLIKANIVKNKKFRFRADISGVTDTRGFQVGLCFLCNIARIFIIIFVQDGIFDVADY